MKIFEIRMIVTALACCAAAWTAGAQQAPKPAYLDTTLPAEQRGFS